MPLSIRDPELFGVCESGATLFFRVEDASGPVDAEARVVVDGELRATSQGPAATRCVRVEGLAPGASHRVEIRVDGARAEPDEWFPPSFETRHSLYSRLVHNRFFGSVTEEQQQRLQQRQGVNHDYLTGSSFSPWREPPPWEAPVDGSTTSPSAKRRFARRRARSRRRPTSSW